VTDGALKLTAYFAERERAGSGFLADEMFDLFAQRRVVTSVMLRGISGFGHRRIIRTDESLTLSEDPAVAVAAVDTAQTIRALAGEVAAMTTSGLITVERARLLDGDVPAVPLRDGDDSVKLTIYVGRKRRADGVPAYKAVCALLRRHGFDGASVFLGVDGTAHGERRRARFVGNNADVPLMIIAVGTSAQVRTTVAELDTLLNRPLMTVERAQVCKNGGRLLRRPPALPESDDQGRRLWQKLMVFTSEADLHDGVPIHRALVRRLWETGASGATVLRGVWGFQGDREPHGDKAFQFGRQVPVMTVIIDTPSRVAAGFDIVDALTAGRGLVTCEMVPALLAVDADSRHGTTDLADYPY
jgi:PII-like signaling protein